MALIKRRLRIYERLLNLYPAQYRHTYCRQMLQTAADMLDNEPTPIGRLAVYTRLYIDLPSSLVHQQIYYLGGTMTRDMPAYVKRNALLSGLLLVPFVAAIAANSLDRLFKHQTLYQSWAWSTPVLALWVKWLPLGATLIAGMSFIVYIIQRMRTSHKSFREATLQVQFTWPLLLVVAGGLFVLAILYGHDSVHCIAGNPIHELQNWHQTLRCIQRG